ncbi:cell division protein SepF [Syntrophomonas palmitatica]|uniref:cell division protein SepF n=1 Tax=Syntrophomonas palmitatica TaxID=402877 RepID=UPI0006D18874|nr:cell division protein SepF [Syntrophomonas palmitatica]
MGWFARVWNWLGLETEEVEREELVSLPQGLEESSRKMGASVVSLHTSKSIKVVVCEPVSFEEVQTLGDHLKARKQVILNFENTDAEVTRRIFDFISGTTYALEGSCHQLGKHIYVFAPSNVEVARDHRSLMRRNNKSSFLGGEQ